MTRIETLLIRRDVILNAFKRHEKFINEFDDPNNINLLKTRVPLLRDLWDEFHTVQFDIEVHKDKPDPIEQEAIRESVETQYCAMISKINTFEQTHVPNLPSTNQPNQNVPSSSLSKPKLPALNLPTFSGKYTEWLGFYNTFDSLINKDSALSDSEKMHYLKSCLTGNAARSIESLSISNENYKSALEILTRKYKNTRVIVQEHVFAIMRSPSAQRASASALSQLLHDATANIAALKSLGIPVDKWDDWLVPVIAEKMDYASNREWIASLPNNDLPNFSSLIAFIEKRCSFLETIDSQNKTNNVAKAPAPKQAQFTKRSNSFVTSTSSKLQCVMCKADHTIQKCPQFLNLEAAARRTQIQNLNLCWNCLRDNHKLPECKSKSNCRECQQRHHTLLHSNQVTEHPASLQTNHCLSKCPEVLLSTAIIQIQTANGKYVDCRALLDVGSQSNFVTSHLCKRLGLKLENANNEICGINHAFSNVSQLTEIKIKSNFNSYTAKIKCLVLQRITENIPGQSFDSSAIQIPPNIKLADPQFNISRPVDLLLGAELFWALLCIGQIKVSRSQPYLQKSQLGWLVGGPYNFPEPTRQLTNTVVNNDKILERQVAKLLEVETFPEGSVPSSDNINCENHFLQTHQRDTEGRFIVRLPIKGQQLNLGQSRDMALRRFYSLEKKLVSNSEFKHKYSSFIQEYLELGHMEPVPANEINYPRNYYLPHHAVCKEGLKFRVVFDGSAATSNGVNLNENLSVGGILQEDLFSIITRFRTHQFVITADIIKMFRQILTHPLDRDLQRIIWRDHPDKPIQTFRLNTVTYGLASSPFLAVRCLHQLAHEAQETYPAAAAVIKRDFYMDDLLSGSDSLSDLLTLRDDLIQILAKGGFQLGKWASNCVELLPIDQHAESNTLIDLDKGDETKLLGLLWNPNDDTLKYKISKITHHSKTTKRTILSTVAQLFDPLGLIGPIIVRAKIILQQLWRNKLGWDESVPIQIHTAWSELKTDLQNIELLTFARKTIYTSPVVSIEMHGFCDSSEVAYGAALYLRATDSSGQHSTQLLCAKSRVAPLKNISLPRLELSSALLLARLFHKVRQILNIRLDNIFLWSDSTITLAWIAAEPSRWQTFVANRVSEIQNLTNDACWNHIRSHDNPADLLSRGATTSQLMQSKLWIEGPSWLIKNASEWPQSMTPVLENSDIPEKRKLTLISLNHEQWSLPILTKFSSYTKTLRITAYCLRFIYNSKNKSNKRSGPFSPIEIKEAITTIVKLLQHNHFFHEISDLASNKQVNNKSKLKTLDPFIDNDGILRVGGRLRNSSSLPYDRKFPIIIPRVHHITNCIIQYYHVETLHSGHAATLAALREKFWIISGRNAVRKVLHRCIACFKTSPRSLEEKMGDLPNSRIEPARPFLKSGVDFAGPILIKEGARRSKRKVKAYICLFICFATKAIHVELVGDLTAESFINALKRFISRRGHITDLFCDNATNFVGAKHELDDIYKLISAPDTQQQLTGFMIPRNISWHFIPPRAPHMGGVWEAGIKSVKRLLKRIIGDASLTYEELYTFLVRIEACLNSRPLAPLTDDPNDLLALTPAHFLIGESLMAPVEPNLTTLSTTRLSRWQRIEQLRQHFWNRWTKEYVAQLQVRTKWLHTGANAATFGALVLLMEDGVPPLQWRLGRIVQLHPGPDGITRVVSVKTSAGVFKRNIKKLCVLPIDDE